MNKTKRETYGCYVESRNPEKANLLTCMLYSDCRVVPRDIKLGNKKLVREKYIIDNSEQFPKQNPTSNFKILSID
jgi:hypothetical protein